MNESFGDGIALADVDFQNDVAVRGTVSADLRSALTTEAFPLSGPASLRTSTDYQGMKVFVHGGRSVCMSYFFFRDKTDQFRRAIASARVLIVNRERFGGGFRNVIAVRDFLRNTSIGAFETPTERARLQTIHATALPTQSMTAFRDAPLMRGASVQQTATALGALVAKRRLVICAQERAAGEGLLARLFAFAPIELLQETTWCSYADSLDGFHEDVVVGRCVGASDEPRSMFARLTARFQRTDESKAPRVDAETGSIEGTGKDVRARVATRVAGAIFDDALVLPLEFDARFSLLVRLLGALTVGSTGAIEECLNAAEIPAEARLTLRRLAGVDPDV